MARKPRPWWHAEKQAWFVHLDGQRYRLCPDRDQAHREFHRLLSLTPEQRAPKPEVSSPSGLTVAELLDTYLEWVAKHRAARTYDWYRKHLDSLVNLLAAPATMLVCDLKPFMVSESADRHATWGDNYRRGALIAVQRPFNWAAKLGRPGESDLRRARAGRVPRPPGRRAAEAAGGCLRCQGAPRPTFTWAEDRAPVRTGHRPQVGPSTDPGP